MGRRIRDTDTKYFTKIPADKTRNDNGTFKEGVPNMTRKITNEYGDNKLFQHEVKEIELVVSSVGMSALERGEKFLQFQERWGLSNEMVGEYFGVSRPIVSQTIRSYKRVIDWKIDLDKHPHSTIHRAMETATKENAEKFLKVKDNFPSFSSKRLHKLVIGTTNFDKETKRIKADAEKDVKELDKVKEFFKRRGWEIE